jgi:hypothetical protein
MLSMISCSRLFALAVLPSDAPPAPGIACACCGLLAEEL